MKILIVSVLAILISASFAIGQESGAASTPAERLARMAGRWKIEERYAGDPAVYVKTSSCELFAGGLHVVCRSEAETPLGPSTSLAILSYEPNTRTYTHYAIASVGVAALVRGRVTDTAWVGETEFPFNGQTINARVITTDVSPTSWTYTMEGSLFGGRVMVLQSATATKEH